MPEARFAVGEPEGRRSTVWKFFVQKNEAYIATRMFGSDAKVSFHSTGQCQWSATDRWVRASPERRNADRHIVKWLMPRPAGAVAVHVFRVRIPESELRVIPLQREKLDAVEWLPAPVPGQTVSIECYFTPPTDHDPTLTGPLPARRIFSMQLHDRRWFVGLHTVFSLDGKSLEPLRQEMNALASRAGIEPEHKHRACAFTDNGGATRGLIELCTVAV
jgi:hypothetical protein